MIRIASIWKHHRSEDEVRVYVGRACRGYPQSPLGNPYRTSKGEVRGSTLDRYRAWLKARLDARDPAVCNEVLRIAKMAHEDQPVTLLCWCAPTEQGLTTSDETICHGQIIAGVVEQVVARMGVSSE